MTLGKPMTVRRIGIVCHNATYPYFLGRIAKSIIISVTIIFHIFRLY